MQRALFVAAIGLSGLTAAPVHAMQVEPLSTSAPYVTLVAGGCGVGFHRGPYGGCRPNGYGYGVGGVVVGVPAYHYGYGYHGGYYGWHGGGYHYGYHYGYHGGGYHYHYHYH
jgi:hypothetical protein